MTTPTSAPQGIRETFDTGPLSWVIGEIREALTRSKTSLHEAVWQDAETQPTALRHAKTYLHQAHGALQIVDVDGVAIITETVEDLFDRMDRGQLVLTQDIAQAIDNAYLALIEYLEELLSGAPHQPVRLFPYYRALLQVRAAERIHPADLFFPNLAIRPQLPPGPQAPDSIDYVMLRKRFERSLLPFLKSSDGAAELADASAMRDMIKDVERSQSNQQSRAFWWVMHGFAEAVAGGQVQHELYVKQLFARINLQIRRLSEGSTSIAERLLRDALFFIARAENPSARVRQIRQAYQLDGQVPLDYDRKRYGQIDADALAAAKEHLSQAKSMWNRIAGGASDVAPAFEQEMNGLAEAGAKLNSLPLAKLLRELGGIARHAARAKPGDAVGLEMATSMLFVENALSHIGHLSDNFAERADAMSARLLSIVSGEKPAESAQWLDDMSREAQERQTMMALAAEMQTSLRQVEKMLDEYFNDPTQRAALTQIDKILHQIGGALSILDQDDAMRAVAHTQAAVLRFAEVETVPDVQQFQQVARNVGALSFFIETLQLHSEGVKKRFSFDELSGVFHANLLEKSSTPQVVVEVDDDVLDVPAMEAITAPRLDAPVLPTVEADLLYHQQQSAELAVSLTAEPNNPVLQEQLKESLEQVRLDATLVHNPEANDRAQAAIDILDRPGFVASPGGLSDIVTATAQAQAPIIVAPVTPESDEAIDAELLEIFLSEAEEVLACVKETAPASRSEPYNQDHLTTLRRSFHTLKGSGRMVGLVAFGEAAWSIEQVINLRLSETRAGDADLYALLDKAAEVLGAWVVDLQTQGRSDRTPTALAAAAERVKLRGAFHYVEESPVVAIPSAVMSERAVPDAPVGMAIAAAPDQPSAPQAMEPPAAAFDDGPAASEHLPFEPAPKNLPLAPASITDADLPPAMLPVEEVELSDADFAALQHGEVPDQALELPVEFTAGGIDFGTLPALDNELISEPTGEPMFTLDELAIAELPQAALADVIDFPGLQVQQAKHDDNVKHIGDLEISVPLHNIYLAETDELVRLLSQDVAEWRHEPDRQVNIHAVHAAHSLAGSSATVGFRPLQEVAHALEAILQYLARKPSRLSGEEYNTLDHAIERIRYMLQMFALGEMPDHEPQQVQILERMQQGIEARLKISPASSSYSAPTGQAIASNETAATPAPSFDTEPTPWLEVVQMPVIHAPTPSFTPSASATAPMSNDSASQERIADTPFEEPVFAEDVHTDPALVLKDELDADLLPVFIEEGRDMLPQMGQALRGWQQNPADQALPQAVLRLLHTIKGSARMAGAMTLGQHMHELETRIEQVTRIGAPSAQALDDLLARHDHGLQLFEELQNPQARTAAPAIHSNREAPMSTVPTATTAVITATTMPEPTKVANAQGMVELTALMPARTGNFAAAAVAVAKASVPAAPVPLVRVRADILDRLVNQAGEVSISRSKLETEVGTIKTSLVELTENVTRLRDQLREIEIQAETQITSRMAHSADREFDPLEFDRFTRLQELTRMMAESVNDVGSVQQNLAKTVDSATTDLITQARLTRDLQQDLMRVRMVQFASISERLYRVTRQASKEVDKRVNLDIRGSAVEIDRGVLEKMAGPFEHLLRNAIVHGIEPRELRQASGKADIGELLVEIRQEGNEVVIQFSDDGQGLDLAGIRHKAKSTGLLTDDRELSDSEVTDLIFHPGFSTADEVTELAGRGVGMDVVRSEAAALGGRVEILSEPGKGAHFTIHLPLTLAVTQVVILTTGGKTYAVPSVLVEQVQQLKTNPLAAAYNEGAVLWHGNRVPMYYLSTLLGDREATAVSQQYSPIIILKSGNERVAVHVDEILGNREVVVKNIGPQLARMIGIAGATVLGSGEIVLILNPVPLAQRAANENMRAPRLTPDDAPHGMGAVAEMGTPESAAPKAGAVQGLRTQHIVMVVDDSLTVRRVTQRLLAREGYQVVLAKDGVDALEHLQSITPDVMLVDIEMPRMDGFDLTRNVRGDERTRHIPIIMITSRTATKHRNYAMELGVNEYLGKPYQEDALLKSISGFINNGARVV